MVILGALVGAGAVVIGAGAVVLGAGAVVAAVLPGIVSKPSPSTGLRLGVQIPRTVNP